MAVFVPWDGDRPRPASLDALHSFLVDPGQSVVRPPPGHGGGVAHDLTSQPHLVAGYALRLLRHHMQDIHVSHQNKLLNGAYRFRNRHLWTDLERAQYKAYAERESGVRGKATAAEDLAALQAARRYDERRVRQACLAEQWADELVAQADVALPLGPGSGAAGDPAGWRAEAQQMAAWPAPSTSEVQDAHRRMAAVDEAASLETP